MSAKRLRLLTAIGVILITAVIAAGLLLTYAVPDSRVIPLPSAPGSAVSGDGISPDVSGEVPADGTPIDGLVRLDITVDNVQDVIETLRRSDNYSRRIIVENYYAVSEADAGGEADTAAVYDNNVFVYNGALSLKTVSTNETKNIILVDGRMYVWYAGDKKYYETSAQQAVYGEVAADEFQMILSYEDVLAVDKAALLEADNVYYDGENAILVRYKEGAFGYTTVCYISTASGLLIHAEQYDQSRLIYRMTASEYDDTAPELSAFDLPDGTNAIENT